MWERAFDRAFSQKGNIRIQEMTPQEPSIQIASFLGI
jgi:hypothetical protein